jgi:hypothetical protein
LGAPIVFSGKRSKLLTAQGLLTSAGRTVDYDGAINYIANPGAEIVVTGYNAFANTAQSTPTNGTGGAPSVTIARSTVSSLVGDASLLFTKTAVNSQGQGFSYDFSIDSGFQSKAFTVSMLYKVASGTYVDSDMSVWLYDVTNATVIQPTGSNILNAIGATLQTATFQAASNSTSYRLIFFCGSTSALAYTLNFDQISVSPNTYNIGAVVTDWALTTGFTANNFGSSTYALYSRRVGGSMEVRGIITTRTSTAATASLTLPVAVDSSKMSSSSTGTWMGMVERSQASSGGIYTAGNGLTLFYDGSDTAKLYFASSVGGGSFTKANASTLASGETISVDFSFPVLGWGTSQVLSSDTATNVVAAIITGVTSGAAIAAGNPITFLTVVKDTNGAYNPTTGQYTAPVPGYYDVKGCLNVSSSSTSAVAAYVAGSKYAEIGTITTGAALGAFAGQVYALAGQTIDVRVLTGTTTASSPNTGSSVSFTRVSGPAQIASSETVAASYWSSGNTSMSSSTPLNADTKFYDTHGAVTTGAAWKFTAPIPGKYTVKYFINNSGSVSSSSNIQIFKNGTAYKSIVLYRHSQGG